MGVVLFGAGIELYAAFFNPHFPTFTGLVRKFVPRILTAAVLGALFYHFLIQPLYPK